MPKDPIHKKVEGHFFACTACDYEGGFHVTFKRIGESELCRIILMCPQCEQTYDIDWQIRTQKSD